MEYIFIYVFFTSVVYATYLYDKEHNKWEDILFNIIFAVLYGWFATPILIGGLISNAEKSQDAFIDKAWNYIEDNLLSSNQLDNSHSLCERFKKAMRL